MARSMNSLIMEKLENLEEMAHQIKTDVAVSKEQLKQINGRVNKHDEEIAKNTEFRTELKGKVAIVTASIGVVVSVITAWITSMFTK